MNKLIAILNCDKNFGIGKKNGLLFVLPLDMAYFRKTTSGHVVAMGENTLLSFPGQKPLKNRTNIVLSKNESHEYEDVINVHSMEDFHKAIKESLLHDDVFIIGGASIYTQMLPFYHEILLNKVDDDGEAEVFFANIDLDPRFRLVEEGEPIEDNGHVTRLCRYIQDYPEEL